MAREVYALIDSEESYYPDLYSDNIEYLQGIQMEKDQLVTFIEKSAADKLAEALRRTNAKLNKAGVRFTFAEKALKEYRGLEKE